MNGAKKRMIQESKEAILEAVKKAHPIGVSRPRSTDKLRILHDAIKAELSKHLEIGNDGAKYVIRSMGPSPKNAQGVAEEKTLEGAYNPKKVDIYIESGDHDELGVVSVKFVLSNYSQNSYNYFEQSIGETANLKSAGIMVGLFFCLTNPIPYKNRGGNITRHEHVGDKHVDKYRKLLANGPKTHVPDAACFVVFGWDSDSDAITGYFDVDKLDISDENKASLKGNLSLENFFANFPQMIKSKCEGIRNESNQT